VDLEADPAASETLFSLDVVPTHSSIFDPASTRLYVTARYNGVGAFAPLRYMALARPDPGEFTKVDLSPFLRGAEPQGAALSSDRSRIFLGLRVYDPDEAARIGVRPIADLAGALVVLDAADSASGQLPAAPIAIVPIDHGPTVVRTLPRAGKRDLVFITANDDSSLIVYDDETGAIAQELTLCDPGTLSTAAQPSPADPLAPFPCPAGRARLGAQPFGLAVEPRAPTAEFPELPNGFARLYVGSFDRSWVNVIDLDPEHPQKAPQPQHWWRIGQERP
jgi:hypothetical protein